MDKPVQIELRGGPLDGEVWWVPESQAHLCFYVGPTPLEMRDASPDTIMCPRVMRYNRTADNQFWFDQDCIT